MDSLIRKLRKERGMTGTRVAKILNITPTYFYEIERGKKRLSADMASSLAEIFGVTTDYLLGRTEVSKESPKQESENHSPYYALTPKEEKDIAERLEAMMDELESDVSLAFMGEPMDEEDRELLRISLENTLRMSKQMAKKKFTPKKYRK
ncbi:helix-turn-helix transcriptional regulator [Paenibacillus larvae]